MENILEWFAANWWWVLLLLAAVMKVLNKITLHFAEHKGLVRWCLFLVDLLDVVKSTPAPTVEQKVLRGIR